MKVLLWYTFILDMVKKNYGILKCVLKNIVLFYNVVFGTQHDIQYASVN